MKLSDIESSRWNFSKKSLQDRFWSKVEKTDDCWVWKGTLGNTNYGEFIIKKNGKWVPMRPSRLSYLLKYGVLPDDKYVLHTCDTPLCVNPNHLFIGTQKDNIQDALKKGRIPKGENSYRAKLSEAQIREIRSRYIPRVTTQRQLASEFGVSHTVIGRVINNLSYKNSGEVIK